LKQADQPDKDYDDYLLIKAIFDMGRGRYGWRSVEMRLPQGVMNHKKISRIMRKYNLNAKIRRANPYRQMAKKTLSHRTFNNLLDREFKPAAPFRVFCTDITYLPYNYRLAYLSVIKDIGSGEVVAWNLAENLTLPIVFDTLNDLKKNVDPLILRSALIHSDQGFHYTHPDYIKAVKDLGLIQSMSRKGNCIDNAPIESFFGHFKDDVDYRRCRTFEELKLMVAEYMHFYNHGRYQWELKKMTPVGYRNHLLAVCV
jgi:putative transposase